MAGSNFGKLFKITTWGESHGVALGVTIDGCPAGVYLNEEDIQKLMDRRKPGNNKFATKRNESDKVQILSGVFEGKTTGTPISIIVYNEDQKSRDYSEIKNVFRPGHADFTFYEKYEIRDYRGGGRSSGRETIGRVAAGAVAMKILNELKIDLYGYTIQIANVNINRDNFDKAEISKNPLCMPDKEAYEKAEERLKEIMENEDSAGGAVEIIIKGLKAGVGEPVFDKLDANLSKAIFSIGGVKAFEIGAGFSASSKLGSENNDGFYYDEDNNIKKLSNNSGGILGGISDGSDIVLRIYFKPTPSIHKTQNTADENGNNIKININGRHDPTIVSRALVVAEAMTALTIVDLIFENTLSKISNIKKIYMEE